MEKTPDPNSETARPEVSDGVTEREYSEVEVAYILADLIRRTHDYGETLTKSTKNDDIEVTSQHRANLRLISNG